MANYFTDNDDLRFYFEKGLDWDALVKITEFDFQAQDGFTSTEEALRFYNEIMELVGGFVGDEIAPRAEAIDAEGATLVDGEVRNSKAFDEIFEQFKALQIYGLNVPRELGGLNCPAALYFALTEVVARGDVSVLSHYGFHGGIAMAMLMYAADEGEGSIEFDPETGRIKGTRFDAYIQEIISGDAWGCMDLTEPDAGSDLSKLRTRGYEKDGQWYVDGQKIFITSGHGKYHFVLARTEEEKQGLDALSLFLVPLEIDGEKNGYVDRVEEKLGHKGSATCSVIFEDSKAELVGKRGEGFKGMLLLMNNARVGVGFESIGLCENAYRMAKAYAAERQSMGKTIDRHELIADYLDEMDVTIKGLRALAFYAAFHEEMSRKLEMKRKYWFEGDEVARAALKRQAKFHARKARKATPLLKYVASEKAVEMARMNMQIHGGVGYMKEYDPQRLLRDALVMPIYEGTSQIQSLMAMKDHLLGAIRDARGFVRRSAAAAVRHRTARDPLTRRLAGLETLAYSAQQNLLMRIARRKWSWATHERPLQHWAGAFMKDWDPKRDFAPGLLHAERLTKLLGEVSVCRALCKQAEEWPERRELAERYLERAEPKVRHLYDEIIHTGDRLLAELETHEPAEGDTPVMEAV